MRPPSLLASSSNLLFFHRFSPLQRGRSTPYHQIKVGGFPRKSQCTYALFQPPNPHPARLSQKCCRRSKGQRPVFFSRQRPHVGIIVSFCTIFGFPAGRPTFTDVRVQGRYSDTWRADAAYWPPCSLIESRAVRNAASESRAVCNCACMPYRSALSALSASLSFPYSPPSLALALLSFLQSSSLTTQTNNRSTTAALVLSRPIQQRRKLVQPSPRRSGSNTNHAPLS